MSIDDAMHPFQNTVVNIFIYQYRKALLCVLLYLLKSVYHRDKV